MVDICQPRRTAPTKQPARSTVNISAGRQPPSTSVPAPKSARTRKKPQPRLPKQPNSNHSSSCTTRPHVRTANRHSLPPVKSQRPVGASSFSVQNVDEEAPAPLKRNIPAKREARATPGNRGGTQVQQASTKPKPTKVIPSSGSAAKPVTKVAARGVGVRERTDGAAGKDIEKGVRGTDGKAHLTTARRTATVSGPTTGAVRGLAAPAGHNTKTASRSAHGAAKDVTGTTPGAVQNLAETGRSTAGAIRRGDIKGTAFGFASGVGSTVDAAGQGVGGTVRGVGHGIDVTASGLGRGVGDTIGTPVGKAVGDTAGNLGKSVSGATKGVGDAIGSTTRAIGRGNVGGVVSGATGGAGSAVGHTGRGVGRTVEGLGKGVGTILPRRAGSAVQGIGKGTGDAVAEVTGGAGDGVSKFGRGDIIGGVGSTVGGVGKGVGGFASGVWGGMTGNNQKQDTEEPRTEGCKEKSAKKGWLY